MAEIERATSDESFTSETRRTTPGSPSSNKVAFIASILPPMRRPRGFSAGRLEPSHGRAIDEVELLLEVHDGSGLRLRHEGDGVDQRSDQLDPAAALRRRFGGQPMRQVGGVEAVAGVNDPDDAG